VVLVDESVVLELFVSSLDSVFEVELIILLLIVSVLVVMVARVGSERVGGPEEEGFVVVAGLVRVVIVGCGVVLLVLIVIGVFVVVIVVVPVGSIFVVVVNVEVVDPVMDGTGGGVGDATQSFSLFKTYPGSQASQ